MAFPMHRDEFGNIWFSQDSYREFVRNLPIYTPRMHRENDVLRARERALKLLRSQLSERQWVDLCFTGKFQVFTGKGPARRRFWIKNTGRTFNVHGWLVDYCVISRDRSVPLEDEMLMKKLMIESDPDTFFKIANWNLRHWVMNTMLIVGALSAAFVIGVAINGVIDLVRAVW